MKIKALLSLLIASTVSIAGAFAQEDINAALQSALPQKLEILATDGPDAVSKSSSMEIEACTLTHVLTIEREGKPELPYRQTMHRDLRFMQIQDFRNDPKIGADIVRLGFKKNAYENIKEAVQPVRSDLKAQVKAEEEKRGLGFLAFDKKEALAYELVDEMVIKLKAGAYGDTANRAFTIVNGRLQAALPFTQLYVAEGQGAAIAKQLQEFMNDSCE